MQTQKRPATVDVGAGSKLRNWRAPALVRKTTARTSAPFKKNLLLNMTFLHHGPELEIVGPDVDKDGAHVRTRPLFNLLTSNTAPAVHSSPVIGRGAEGPTISFPVGSHGGEMARAIEKKLLDLNRHSCAVGQAKRDGHESGRLKRLREAQTLPPLLIGGLR